MKHRWIGVLALAAVLTLAACRPQGGDGPSAEPSGAAQESAAPHDMESHAPSESDDEGGRYDY